MSVAVEARSLSSLTTLAADPPSNPPEYGDPVLEPLTLYIARVPGSRDVFLTPLKPREKVVTAEDVQSCLYYVHVDGPDDHELLKNAAQSTYEEDLSPPNPDSSSSLWPAALSVPDHKQLLKPSPDYLATPQLQSQSSPQLVHAATTKPMARKPVAPPRLSVRQNVQNQHNMRAPDIYRSNQTVARPSNLPPTPPYPVDFHSPSNLQARENTIPNPKPQSALSQHHSNHYPELTPPLPPRPSIQSRPFSHSIDTRQPFLGEAANHVHGPMQTQSEERPKYLQRRSTSGLTTSARSIRSDNDNLSLTVIRRDPGTGQQWNVARVSDPPVYEVSSMQSGISPSKRNKEQGAPIYLEIGTSGYEKFRDGTEVMTNGAPVDASVEPFRRHMWMENTRIPDKPSHGHQKTDSLGSIEDSASSIRSSAEASRMTLDGGMYPPASSSGRRGPKGYIFLSPWDSRCEFSSGGSGRTLKCRHHRPASLQAASVSELRFNLPSTHPFRSAGSVPTSKSTNSTTFSKRSSVFSRSRHRRHDSATPSAIDPSSQGPITDSTDPLDISLGQEAAGGGFGGKQAKLGKLIIENDGFKMLDLTVAANMALFLRAHERTRA